MMEQDPIFIVDDDQGILESFDAMLGDEYQLMMVSDGDKALELLSRHHPRLVFLDLKIPGSDGLAVLAGIRAKGLSTRVVIVTALAQDHYQEMAEKYGVYRYLHKPLDVDEIMEITRTLIH
jgi:DNA-binding NtrC family response regulator